MCLNVSLMKTPLYCVKLLSMQRACMFHVFNACMIAFHVEINKKSVHIHGCEIGIHLILVYMYLNMKKSFENQ